MTQDELNELFDFLKKQMNPKLVLEFKLIDMNSIVAYMIDSNTMVAILYIDELKKLIKYTPVSC